MRTGRSITMDSVIWTAIGNLSETSEFDGDVSETIERLCREALEARGVNYPALKGLGLANG